ncbi:hypothetical protein [Arthrobacter sp. OY3WO11]|uniref:hypothetical protein n=1 Tax=Arthrobacter sp. OY3WO11 TaxID=1835723 RepID=UPI0007CF7527|nr:hypothetical protein [Arthrobacter sp. OY3WO11]OAE00157.1 hypothetical protein A6A22_00940 [Arthrobacter sp. OY3WO11]
MLLPFVVAASAVISFVLIMGRAYHVVILLVIAAGWSQAPLITLTRSDAFQYLDDVPAAVLVAAAVIRAFSSQDKRLHKALGLMLLLVILVGIGFIRSPDADIGIAQARQVLMPLGLVFAGFVYRDDIKWRKVSTYLLLLTALTVAWALAEEVMQAPLLDPAWYHVNVVGGNPRSMRMGLPPAYFADGVSNGELAFRPGGPFMNPPVMGFLLGLGAFAAVARLRSFARLGMLAAIGLTLFFAYARAGILLFLVVTVIYFIWTRIGKYAGILVGAGLGGYLLATFMEQGNTASHSDGLFSGFMLGLQSPGGLGFGTTGYQAALEGASTGVGSESLLGLYFAWIGWPMIAAALLLLIHLGKLLRRVPRTQSLPVWLAVGFLLTVASSESASSMASTPVLWLTVGSVVAMAVPLKPEARPVPAAMGSRFPSRPPLPRSTSRR